MTSEGIAILRGLGLPEDALDILQDEERKMLISGESLKSWLRAAYLAGKNAKQDPYVWYSVEELMGRPLA